MNFLLIPLLFIIWRIFDFLVIFFSQKVIPYLGFFPYRDQLPSYLLPRWISALANFDGLHYILIAKNGYSEFEQAFFPLYPLIIRLVAPLFSNNQLLTGLLISNVSFLFGLILFYKYLKLISSDSIRFNPILSVLFLLAFPTSFYFGAVYTEGLFFLLLVSTLYFLKKESYLLVIIFSFLAALTRFIGVFLIIPIILHFFNKNKKPNIYHLASIISPLIGLVLYCFYLWQTTGDPLFFLTSQPIFGANRSSHLILLPQVYWRYLKIFFTANHDFRYFISLIEFSFFNFVFVVLVLDLFKSLQRREKIKKFDLLGLNLFSLANLILPTLTGTFSSIPRYVVFSLSFFIYLSRISPSYAGLSYLSGQKQLRGTYTRANLFASGIKGVFIKYLILSIFLILHILLLGYFSQGYFIS